MAKQVSPGVLALRKVVDDVYADAREAKKQGKLVGWSSSKFPCELAEAFDLNVMYPENQAAGIAAQRDGEIMCQAAEDLGFDNDICGYARISLAYAAGKRASRKFDPETLEFIIDPNSGKPLKDENGKVVYGSITPETKEGLAYLAQLYTDGILDQQFTTRDYSDTLGLITSGRCGICFYPWNLPYSGSEFAMANPEGEWVVVEAPVNDKGEFTYSETRTDNGLLCVRKGYEHPEVAIKILNVEFDMYRGFDQEGYETLTPLFEAGTSWTAPMLTGHFNLEYDDAVIRIGSLTANYIEKGVTPTGTTQYNIQLCETAKRYFDNPDPSDTEGWICYTSRYIASNALKSGVKVPVAFHYATESMGTLWASMEKVEDQYFLETIVGQASIDGFDDFVSQWLMLGGDITAEVQAYCDSHK